MEERRVEDILIELLKEIDDLCREEGIPYYLSGETALLALREGRLSDGSPDSSLLMRPRDARRFREAAAAAGREDRYLEGMFNNRSFPAVCLHYGNEKTLDMDTVGWGNYRHHGLHVTIDILRSQGRTGFLTRLRAKMEYAWEMSIAVHVRFHRFLAPLLYRLATGSGDGRGYYLKPRGSGRRIALHKELFQETAFAEAEGRDWPLPGEPERFLALYFGKHPESALETMGQYDTEDRLVSPEISYEELREELASEGEDISAIWQKRRRFVREYKYVALLNLRIRKAWAHLFLSGDRYALWDIYMPRKERLRSLLEQEDYETLTEEFALYSEQAEKHLANKLGLCFDKEIFDIYCETLLATGRGAFAKELCRRVPKKHWQPIRIKNYKGEYLSES